jgi:uncharacterized protein YndB with AHSA1/START domain
MIEPVRKSITVKCGQEHAFKVFTEGFDSWWPRSHHIGKSPLKKTILEGFVGGRCYSEQEDGTDCPWGLVTVWEPPSRLVFVWQITGAWQFEADLAYTSEVEVNFTALEDGSTRVDLEHRNFERMPAGGEQMRAMVDSPGGWGTLLDLFGKQAEL